MSFCDIKYEWSGERATFSLISSLDLVVLKEYFDQLKERYFPENSLILGKFEINGRQWYTIETDSTCEDVRLFYNNMINGTILEHVLGEYLFRGEKYWNVDKVVRTSQLSPFELQSIFLFKARRNFYHKLSRRLKAATTQLIDNEILPDAQLIGKLGEKYGIREGKFIHYSSPSEILNPNEFESSFRNKYIWCVTGWFNGEFSLFNKIEIFRDRKTSVTAAKYGFMFFHRNSRYLELMSSRQEFTMKEDPECYKAYRFLVKRGVYVAYKLDILSTCALNRNVLLIVGCYNLSTLKANNLFLKHYKEMLDGKENEDNEYSEC